MCNHERLLDYLYDELSADERKAFEIHVHDCSACRSELAALGSTRHALALWSPPDPELGFRIVRKEETPPPRRAFWNISPQWGLAAAAVLLLSVGAAIANLEVRYGSEGFVVRTGWGRSTAPAPAVANEVSAVPVAASSEEWKESLRLLDARLQQLEQSNRPIIGGDHSGGGRTRLPGCQMPRSCAKCERSSPRAKRGNNGSWRCA